MAGSKRDRVSSASEFPGPVALFVLLLVAVSLAYLPAINGRFLWDDDAHVTAPALQSLSGLARIWFDVGATQQYYPLLHSSFWMQQRLWGDWVTGYHLVGLLLHALNGLLVYLVLRRLSIAAPGAAAASLVWALHPVMVESVAWITEQKNTLSGLCYLGALLGWLRFDESRQPRDWWLASLLFLLSLLSKTVSATLPAAILVILWWKRGTLSMRRDAVPLAPWFVAGALAGLFTAWVERHVIGASGAAFDLTWLDRCLLAGRISWFYILKLLAPVNLIFIYPRWSPDATSVVQWIYPVTMLALVAFLFRRRKRNRTPLAGLLFFLGTLFPVLGFLNVYPFQFSYVADHFQYLASLGILVPVSVAGLGALDRLFRHDRRRTALAAAALLALLGVLSFRQSRLYRDMETLFVDVITRNPDSWMAHVHVGTIRQAAGRTDEALEHFERAVAINPDYFGAHLNIGNIQMQRGDFHEAVQAYERSVTLGPRDALARYSLGAALARVERWEEAVTRYTESLDLGLDPALSANAELGLGLALIRLERTAEAIPHMEAALAARPSDAESHGGLALLLLARGESGKAARHFEQALATRPDDPEALNGLAWIRATAGSPADRDGAKAIQLAGRAVELTGRRNAYYLDTLAAALAAVDSLDAAVATAREALELARAEGNASLASEIEFHLSRYQQGN